MAHVMFNHVGGKPPFFDGVKNFDYWKRNMRMYLGSINEQVWHVTEKQFVILNPNDLTDSDKANKQCNTMALNVLYRGMDPKVFEGIKDLETSFEVWEKLIVTYEGTKAVKSAKLYMLKSEFENFKRKKDESIPETFHRLQVIVNDLKSLGVKTLDRDFGHKFLMCLPKKFDVLKKILFRGALDTMTPSEVLGEVLTDEQCDATDDEKEDEKKKKVVAFKAATSSKNKGKSKMQEEEEEQDDGEGMEDIEHELALFVKRFSKAMRNKRSGFNSRGGKNAYKSRKEPMLCFECDSPDHVLADCPIKKQKEKNKGQNERNKYKGKGKRNQVTIKKGNDGAYVVTWDSDNEDDDEDDSSKAMISIGRSKKSSIFDTSSSCFMAKGAKVYHSDSDDDSPCAKQVKFDSDSESENESTNNDNLMEMMKQVEVLLISKGKECNKLRKKVAILEQAICELQANHDCLVEDHGELELAHTKLQKAHSLLLEVKDKESLVQRVNVGITCDILDEISYTPIVMPSSIPSTSTSTHSISTTSDEFTCDASLMVKNETLKREVDELTHALGRAYGGEARLLKCLGS